MREPERSLDPEDYEPPQRKPEREYDPYEDEDFGNRNWEAASAQP